MKNELQQKLSQLIEANFPKMESEVLVRLVSEHEALTKDLFNTQEKADLIKQERDGLREESCRKEKELCAKNNIIEALEKKLIEKTAEFDKTKKDFVELELKCVRESKSEIFELAKIAFRHPDKVRKFDTPIRVENWGTEYNNGNAHTARYGDSVQRHEGQEVISEE
jgi:predicted RNase H-like nuclease (RuvC/YqgF family)